MFQTLIWWSVDYNKEEALKLTLEHAQRGSQTSHELDHFIQSLRDALAWSRRKSNEAMTSLLEEALSRTTLQRHTTFPDVNDSSNDRRTSSADGDDTHHRESASTISLDDVDEDNVFFARMSALQMEQAQLASHMAHMKRKNDHELEVTAMQLEETERKMREMEHLLEHVGQTFEAAREQLNVARAIFQSAEEQFRTESAALELAKTALEESRKSFDEVQYRKERLDALASKIELTTQKMSIQVECTVCTGVALGESPKAKSKSGKSDESVLECPICRDRIVNRSFQCGHSLCKECVREIHDVAARAVSYPGARNDTVKCPICKTSIESIHPLYLSGS